MPSVADVRQLQLTSGRCLHTRVAGIFLFLPLLAKVRLDQLVEQAGYPGSSMVPAINAVLSLLALKLLDTERRSHISDFDFDEALALFAGLNVMPKKSFAIEYSYRTDCRQQRQLLTGWAKALSQLLYPQADTFAVDFHAMEHRGEDTELENHYVPKRGHGCPCLLTFFAQELSCEVLCYANTNLTRDDQAGELLRFVDFWQQVRGQVPRWLYLDCKVVPYAELSRLNERDIFFITIRRRGEAILRHFENLPSGQWQRAKRNIAKRKHKEISFVEETIGLREYEGELRQVAVRGLGRERLTLFLSNNVTETARQLVVRYAWRNRVEDGIGMGVNFFHLDQLTSEVRWNVNVDVLLMVLAQGCYRWLGRQLRGFGASAAKGLYRSFVATAGEVEIRCDRIVVHLQRRKFSPILREAGLDKESIRVPWLNDLPLEFKYS